MQLRKPTIIETITLVISLTALFFSGYQTYIINQHNKKSVLPILDFYYGESRISKLGLFIETVGLGPVIVNSTELTFVNEKINTFPSFYQYAKKKNILELGKWPDKKLFINTGTMFNKIKIDPSDRWVLFNINDDAFNTLNSEQKKYLFCNLPLDFEVSAQYCSIYDECVSITSDNRSIHPICPIYNGKVLGEYNDNYTSVLHDYQLNFGINQ